MKQSSPEMFSNETGPHRVFQQVPSETIRVNSGLAPKDLAAKPADFAPEIPRR